MNAPRSRARGVALGLVVVSLGVLSALGVGLLAVGYGARRQAVSAKAELAAMLAAEAGYEKAVFWMSRQQDMLSTLQQGAPGATGAVVFPDGSCTYQVSLFTFIGARPVYRVLCRGESGAFEKTVDVLVVQAVSGWDMGMCRIPSSASGTDEVNFVSGELIDMPISINKLDDYPDLRDIYISGSPDFEAPVAMVESRYTSGGSDKYSGVIGLFDDGIYFNQPTSKITDESSVQTKINRFRTSTKTQYCLTPSAISQVTNAQPAVQLEFFVEDGVGRVRITNDCTVRGFQQDSDWKTYDFRIRPGTNGQGFERYDIYAYHMAPNDADTTGQRFVATIEDTYVTQSFGGVDSEPGGQIFVNGNVIIGGDADDHNNDQVVKGKITIAATGNIWIADSVYVDGSHDSSSEPSPSNPNALGLLAQGVIKVVDPGLTLIDGTPSVSGYEFIPVGRPDDPDATPPVPDDPNSSQDYFQRHLPDPMVLEAAITVGGGGWGAENVKRGVYGGRKPWGGYQDYLVVHGSIAEAIRGVIGVINTNGYLKSYHMDRRLLTGILPGDIGLRGKFVPAPAGWHDYRPGN
ncbi:MAG: hypothetical protein JW993_07405 [Sedimentisphaerales bacterium]|nr:hypothetical protein [Sedimentisphaerales bacterium]